MAAEIGHFVLQIVGITDGKILSRPSRKHPKLNDLADVHVIKDNAAALTYVPSFSCDGMADTGVEVLVAPCPPDEEDSDIIFSLGNNEPFTHSVFLSVFREIKDQVPKPVLFNKVAPVLVPPVSVLAPSVPAPAPLVPAPLVPATKPKGKRVSKKMLAEQQALAEQAQQQALAEQAQQQALAEQQALAAQAQAQAQQQAQAQKDDDEDSDEDEDNEQFIAINPKIAVELMESIIEKKLIRLLPPVKQFKRNVPIFLEDKVDSTFSFVGICEDTIPFVIEAYNVPFAEYNHGQRTHEKGPGVPNKKNKFNTKTAYFPEKNCPDTRQMIDRIKDLTMVKRESVTRCILAYVVQRTDVDRLQISLYDAEYRKAVREAIEVGVLIVPIVISWTREGVALFVTDDMQVVYPEA
jgi:DNA-binding sugar fermentation-stimulating protein